MAHGDAPAASPSPASSAPDAPPAPPQRKQRGLVSRVWKGIFGSRDDLEKRLQALSNEEAAVRARLRRRARASRSSELNVVALAAALEVVAVGYAIMTTRSLDLSWQMRAVRVLPMFLVPALAALIYTVLRSLTKMLDNRDQHTLEKLRAERQTKIDELKERTNYYTTQQLIQRYDLDPAAKAAAATVLASKLGADSGLRVFVGDESNKDASLTKTNDVQHGQSTGLRQRRPAESNASEDTSDGYDSNTEGLAAPNQRTVEHYGGSAGNDGGWLARVAALLVGEDPTQCYALICGNCHMHNGLARKEDFAFVTYYCPHCNALNGSQQHEGNVTASSSGKESPTAQSNGSSIGHTDASLANSVVGSPAARTLRTVQEVPADDTAEKASTDHQHAS